MFVFCIVVACPIGTYGGACDKICGNCADSAPCHSTTGACPNGCHPGYMSDRCDMRTSTITLIKHISIYIITVTVIPYSYRTVLYRTVIPYSYCNTGIPFLFCLATILITCMCIIFKLLVLLYVYVRCNVFHILFVGCKTNLIILL